MTEYLLLNFVVVAVVFLAVWATNDSLLDKRLLLTLAALLIITAIFDSLIIWLGIVAYDASKILGIYIGKAPIEDFAYTIAAVLLVPLLWKVFTGNNHD